MIAQLSGIHGNLEALHAGLKHAQGAGAARPAFLGDYVGYGANPAEVMAIVMPHVAEGALAIRGKHDDAVAKNARTSRTRPRDAIDWARAQLSDTQRECLAGLPLIVREDPICFVHASAVAPQRWNYVNSPASALDCASAVNRRGKWTAQTEGKAGNPARPPFSKFCDL